MNVLGIDPGLSGALASWNGEELFTLEIPTMKAASRGREVDWADLVFNADLYFRGTIDHGFLERVNSRPGEGVSSAFKFGTVYGGLRVMLTTMGTPYTLVTPQKWKKALSLGNSKDAAVARASQLFPQYAHLFRGPKGGLKDGVAESALIAYYGYLEMN